MKIQNRLEKLEATNKPAPELRWSEEEKQFRDEIHKRMKKAGSTFYHEVCTPDEFERIKQQSSKACLIWYRNNQKDESDEITE